jgi:HSP20 family molecular chaperone IbpA
MDNQSFFPFNGQMPNVNFGELNKLMKEFSEFMGGDFWNTINKLNAMPNYIPNISNWQAQSQNRESNAAHASPFPDQFQHLNAMMQRLNGFLNNDLLRHMYNLNNPNPAPQPPPNAAHMSQQIRRGTIPVQLWETDKQIYLIASLPGIKNSQDIKVTLKDELTVKIRAKMPSFQPEQSSRIIESEFPKSNMEREIKLPSPVSTKSYSSQYEDGVLTLILTKLDDELDIAIFEE